MDCPLGHELSFTDDRDPIADLLNLVEQVAGEHDGPIAAAQAADQGAHFDNALRVEPVGGRISPSNIRGVVGLPAPLGPGNPKASPRWTSRSGASTAVIDGPYRFVRPWVVMTFPFAIGISFTNDV